MDVNFKLETFEGPLDLLLHLIQKNKVEITDIPIVLITKQYLEYLDTMKSFDMEVTGDFLVMASQLVYIKSRLLLPQTEDDDDGIDPRAELVDRLIEYAKYKNAVEYLNPRQENGKYIFAKKPDNIPLPKITAADINFPVSKLLEAFAGVMERRQRTKPVSRAPFETIVKRETVPVSQRIRYLFYIFKQKKEIEFEEFFVDASTRAEAVSTFLAVLELVRRGNMTISDSDGKLLCRLSGDESEFDSIDSDY